MQASRCQRLLLLRRSVVDFVAWRRRLVGWFFKFLRRVYSSERLYANWETCARQHNSNVTISSGVHCEKDYKRGIGLQTVEDDEFEVRWANEWLLPHMYILKVSFRPRYVSTSTLRKKRLYLGADMYAIFSKAHKENDYAAAVLASVGKEQQTEKIGLTLLHGTSSRKMRNTHVRRVYNTCICI